MNSNHSLEERLSALVTDYDLEGIIVLSREAPQGDKDAWKKQIMEEGFMYLYYYLLYDHSCGKLSEGGLDFLSEVVEATEEFHGSPLREMRAQVMSCRLDEVKETNPVQTKEIALQAINELSQEVPIPRSSLQLRADFYFQLAQVDEINAVQHWQSAMKDVNEAADFNLWILYHVWDRDIPGMPEAKQHALNEFHDRLNLHLELEDDFVWQILDDGIRMLEGRSTTELEKQVLIWLELALQWPVINAKPELLRKAGLILHKQGNAHQRLDYLNKAIECFELFIERDPLHAMEVYYLASVWEDRALLEEKNGSDGTESLMNAWQTYQTHEDIVRVNFSSLLHYGEFIERLYFHDKLINGPSIETVRALAMEAEQEGNGFYSGPGMIFARLAIGENDPETAIFHLSRLLLLFELNIDDVISNLRESLTNDAPVAVKKFLDQALIFMKEVRDGYYFHPALSISELNMLSQEETLNAWQERMVEIRNRNISKENSNE